MLKHKVAGWPALQIAVVGVLAIFAFSLLGRTPADEATDAKAGSKPPPQAQPAPTSTDSCSFAAVTTPNTGPTNQLRSLVALAADDVWAVGVFYNVDAGNVAQTLVEHWNGNAWSVVTSPNGGTQDSELTDVAATSDNDVWAVGVYRPDGGSFDETLIEHWHGTRWTIVPSQNPGSTVNFLSGVTAIAPDDAWAVGYYPTSNMNVTLVEHWNGTLWSVVPSPNPGSGGGELKDVSALSANDVWAVGYYVDTGFVVKTLVEHWDGNAWTAVSSPNPQSDVSTLSAVSALSPSDVWAVGSYVDSHAVGKTLVEHWNGIVNAWSVQSSPNQGNFSNQLLGVSALSADDVWTAGSYASDSSEHDKTLTEHWNGTAWSIVPSENPGSQDNFVEGIASVGTGDVWAVGSYDQPGAGSLTLAEHWNGSAWSVAPSEDPGEATNWLASVAAVASNDVWAVGGGTKLDHNTYQTLVEHWDGARWNIVPDPGLSLTGASLTGVSAVAANDIWAVGAYLDLTAEKYQTLAEHWDGTRWSIVPSPNVASSDSGFNGVSAPASDDVWAVGQHTASSVSKTLIEHWDGTRWSIVSSADVGDDTSLYAVSAVAVNEVWAVGNYEANNASHALVEHWNGTVWSQSPAPDPSVGFLLGVTARAANDAWAVGNYTSGGVIDTLVEHWNGSQWTIVPSQSPGTRENVLNGVASASSNGMWAVGYSRGGTDPSQPLVEHWNDSQLSIVPSENPYSRVAGFSSVAPLGANEVWAVGGGSDGMASQTLAERYTCPLCTLQFEDVPAGSTFYPYTRCMACQGIINGYPCGTTGEPCNPTHDPYFRPNSNITRGQIAKIVALSSGNHSPVSGQSFHDVAPGSTFYTYTEQLVMLGVMSGYPCGGVGEPCGPGNLPYFRPNSSATRGQLSKIDANAAGYHDTPSGSQFQDVAPASTFYTYTYELVSRRIMAGYPCGGPGEPCGPGSLPYFRPNANVTRGQTSKIVGNTFFPDCQTP